MLIIVKILYLKKKLLEKRYCVTLLKEYASHQDSNIGYLKLQSPSQEDQLAAIHRQDTILEIPEPRGEAKVPLPDNTD